MWRRLTEVILTIRWPLLLGIILASLVCAYGSLGLNIDPTVETLFVKDSPEYEYYREYRDRYGSDQIIVVAMATPELFEEDHLKTLVELHETFEAFPQVQRVVSLASALDIRHKFLGIKTIPALHGAFADEESRRQVRGNILANELYLNNLVSKDGKNANFIIRLDPTREVGSGVFIRQLRKLLKQHESDDVRFYVAGSPVEQYDFVKLIRKDQFTFVPMIALLLVITTFLIYRSFSCVILSMSIVLVTLLWTFGTIAMLGQELNLVTSLLAPVIMIVAVVNAIHFMNLYFAVRPHHISLRKAILLTIEQLAVPSFLAHITTTLGFLSLAVNPVPAIRSFGLFAASGTFYSFIVALLLTPVLLPALPYRLRRDAFENPHFFNRILIRFLERLEHRWQWLILVSVIAAVAFSLGGIRKLNVDTNIVKQLKPDSELAIATRFIDENLTGVYSIGFVLSPKGNRTVADSEVLREVDRFKSFLEAMPEITKVNSITTLIKTLHQARSGNPAGYRIPDDEEALDQYFEGIRESDNPEVWYLISRDLKELRLQGQMKAVGTKEGTAVEENARDYIRQELSDDFEVHLTGNVVLLGRMAKDLVYYQMRSFGVAFAAILTLITLIFRSLRLGLLAAIPNLLPILMVYGLMGYIGLELSTSTAMISSIVLGLVVDSSIHFLHRFRQEFYRRGHYLQALHHTYQNVGQALVVSAIILMAGFGTSVFASFRPTVHFGVLTSLTIFLALVCTLLALPVWLMMVRPFGPQRLFRMPKASQRRQKKVH